MNKKDLEKLEARALALAPSSSQRLHIPVRRSDLLWLIQQAKK